MNAVVAVSRALAERDMAGRLSHRLAFMADLVAATIYFAAVYYVGRLVPPEMIGGGDYFTVTVIGVGLYGFVSALMGAPRTFLTGEISMGTLETLMTLGPSVPAYVAGAAINRAGRALLRCCLILSVAAWLGVHVRLERVAGLLPVFLLAGTAAFGAGLLQAAIDVKMRSAGRIVALAGGAGSILSGVYFPVALLPEPLQALAHLLPATHAVSAARSILLGTGWAAPDLVALFLLALAFLAAGTVALNRAVRVMKTDGSFSYY